MAFILLFPRNVVQKCEEYVNKLFSVGVASSIKYFLYFVHFLLGSAPTALFYLYCVSC